MAKRSHSMYVWLRGAHTLTAQVTDPSGGTIVRRDHVDSLDYSFDATQSGVHQYCFQNVQRRACGAC